MMTGKLVKGRCVQNANVARRRSGGRTRHGGMRR